MNLIILLIIGSLLSWFLLGLVENRDQLNFQNKKILLPTNKFNIFSRLVVILVFFFIIIVSNQILIPDEHIKTLILVIISIISLGSLYMIIYDFKYFEVPDIFSLFFVIALIIFNFVVYLFGETVNITAEFEFNPVLNLVSGVAFAGFIWVIYLLSKSKGVGDGDIRIAAIIGLLLGPALTVTSFYVTIFSALFVGLIYSIYKKQYKGLKIPFVPFLFFGAFMTFLLQINIFDLLIV